MCCPQHNPKPTCLCIIPTKTAGFFGPPIKSDDPITTTSSSPKPDHSSSPDPLSLDRVPNDIIHLLFRSFDDLPPASLAALAQCSWDLHERFTPVLCRKIEVHKGNMGSVFSGLDEDVMPSGNHENLRPERRVLRRRRKERLFRYTRELAIHDLPSLDLLARVLSAKCLASLRTASTVSRPEPQQANKITPTVKAGTTSYFPTIHPTVFPSLDTLVFSGKAILALADLYNASSWGDSPSLLPSNTLLRSLRDHLRPKRLVCHYPQVMLGLHMHSCIEEVVAYLASSWDLDTLQWFDLPRSMVDTVPKARQLQYHFANPCHHQRSISPTTVKGCAAHYDHISLTASTFIDHLIQTGDFEVRLTLEGVGCIFSLEWEKVVDEVWSRMGVLDEDDWSKMECWKRANVTLLA
ncbi:hypothetical protein IAU59_005445 [Kwoniella sp. CBS 9459]